MGPPLDGNDKDRVGNEPDGKDTGDVVKPDGPLPEADCESDGWPDTVDEHAASSAVAVRPATSTTGHEWR